MEILRNLIKTRKNIQGEDIIRPIDLIRKDFRRYSQERQDEIERGVLQNIYELELYIFNNQQPTTHNINVHLTLNECRMLYKHIFEKNSPTHIKRVTMSDGTIWNIMGYEWIEDEELLEKKQIKDENWGNGLFSKKKK